jgi:hypothetical protein
MAHMLADQIDLWIDSVMDECQMKSDHLIHSIWKETVCEYNKYLYSVNDYNIRNQSLIKRNFTVDRQSLPSELAQSSWKEVCQYLQTHPTEKRVSSGPYSDRKIRVSVYESVSQMKRNYLGIVDHYETKALTIMFELLPSADHSCVIC